LDINRKIVNLDFFLIIRDLMVNISEVEKESRTFNQAIRIGGFSSTANNTK
jgi:hypothetical protein